MKQKYTKVLIGCVVIALLGLALLGAQYLRYSQSESKETVRDIPGAVIAPTPLPETAVQMDIPLPQNPTAVIRGVDGRQASGDITIVTTTDGTFIRLEDNFMSSKAAPDNRVYLGNADGRQVEIAKLKAPAGGQNFRIPDTISIDDYTYIWIHCKAYNTTYGSAQIVRQ